MLKLKITKSAHKLIEDESKKCVYSDRHQYETGGILIGTLRKPIVVEASKPGTAARLDYMRYTNDSRYDNEVLRRAIRMYNGRVKLIGYWHKHPGDMPHPSAVDLATARDIDKRYKESHDMRPVFFIITNVLNKDVKFYCYTLDNHRNWVPVNIIVIEDGSKEIEKALSIETVIIQAEDKSYWDDSDFQFYLTEKGSERLCQEVDELIAQGYSVKAYAAEQLRIVIKKDKKTIVCQPPAEYPLNPPRFFKDDHEIRYSMPIWNSSFTIIDVLQRLEETRTLRRRDHEGNSIRRKSHCIRFTRKIEKTIKSLWFRKEK